MVGQLRRFCGSDSTVELGRSEQILGLLLGGSRPRALDYFCSADCSPFIYNRAKIWGTAARRRAGRSEACRQAVHEALEPAALRGQARVESGEHTEHLRLAERAGDVPE